MYTIFVAELLFTTGRLYGIIAVSYTHLDVYKRQGLECFYLSINIKCNSSYKTLRVNVLDCSVRKPTGIDNKETVVILFFLFQCVFWFLCNDLICYLRFLCTAPTKGILNEAVSCSIVQEAKTKQL